MGQMSSRVAKAGMEETPVRVTNESVGSRISAEFVKVGFREGVK